MQTILGANGQIAMELARELHRNYTSELRLVSRTPRKVNDTDSLVPANLLDAKQTAEAVKGSSVVYFTAGLPPDAHLWEAQFPVMLKNALDASRAAGAKFAYFDNTYMYPQDARLQTEATPFAPVGRKGRVRAAMASMVLDEMAREDAEYDRAMTAVQSAMDKERESLTERRRALDQRDAEINRAINLNIRPMDDLSLYGVAERWTTPLVTFAHGAGDCEDYAIAKYAALRQIGIAEEDLRLVVVYDKQAQEHHAVAAVRHAGRWLVLDNRTLAVQEDADIAHFTPMFTLDSQGVKRLAAAPRTG